MRVIAGTAKGRKLLSVPGDTTRPVTDRVKESLFNILGGDIRDAVLLDLFAGTGGVGIEALSRGARCVVFVDRVQGGRDGTAQPRYHRPGRSRANRTGRRLSLPRSCSRRAVRLYLCGPAPVSGYMGAGVAGAG